MSALKIENLTKIYRNGVEALKGISFDVQEGDFFALLGPNGAGKSTTIGIATSLVTKTSGTVSVFGHDIDRELMQAKRCIGVVAQEFNFSIFEKIENIILMQAGLYGIPRKLAKVRAERYLKQLGLWEKRDQQARYLSGGMKRRLMIARALVHEPKLLILDEPTAGVDIELRRSMWDFLREINQQGTTIILTTHYLEEAENLCRHVAIIDQGELKANESTQQLLQTLNFETFVFYLKDKIDILPPSDFTLRLIDSMTLEVDVEQKNTHNLNQLFHFFDAHNIKITSMRNKANRLEELFMRLVAPQQAGGNT